jgi:hypothetical protein
MFGARAGVLVEGSWLPACGRSIPQSRYGNVRV